MNIIQNSAKAGKGGDRKGSSHGSRGRVVLQTSVQPGREIDTPIEDVITEGQRQLKELAKKQLNTAVSLQSELAKKKEFKGGSSMKSLSQEVAGAKSHETYKMLMDREETIENYMLYGLTEDEINFKLFQDGFDITDRLQSKRKKIELKDGLSIETIDEKIRIAKELLDKPDTFAGAKVLSRQEMDLEKSLTRYKEKSKMLGCLVMQATPSSASTDAKDPINNLDTIYEEALAKTKRKGDSFNRLGTRASRPSRYSPTKDAEMYEMCEPLEPHPEAGCEPRPRTVPVIHESDVVRYRLSIEEIKQIPKFKNYTPGEPSRVLYMKNLSPKVHVDDLKVLFKKFDNGTDKVSYRLLTGKMRGQAFVTFSTKETASEALSFANGYPLHDKPIIIQYGKKKS